MWKLIIIIIIIIIIFFNKNKNKEYFYGLNYIQQHNYLNCCKQFGCKHPICSNYLSANANRLYLTGFLKNKKNRIKLYIRQNNNTERDDYFIKLNKKIKKLKLYRNKLYNGDTIILFNKTYNIIIYNNINPLYRNHNHKFNIFNYNYPVKYNEGNLGFIKPDRLNSRDFLLLYKNNSIRHGWNNKL